MKKIFLLFFSLSLFCPLIAGAQNQSEHTVWLKNDCNSYTVGQRGAFPLCRWAGNESQCVADLGQKPSANHKCCICSTAKSCCFYEQNNLKNQYDLPYFSKTTDVISCLKLEDEGYIVSTKAYTGMIAMFNSCYADFNWADLSGTSAASATTKPDPLKFQPQVGVGRLINTEEKPLPEGLGLLAGYIKTFYDYGIQIAGILAAIILLAAGVVWMAAGGNNKLVGTAKSMIGAAISGLVLLFLAYLILKMINPDLIKLDASKIGYIQGQSSVISKNYNCTEYHSRFDQVNVGPVGLKAWGLTRYEKSMLCDNPTLLRVPKATCVQHGYPDTHEMDIRLKDPKNFDWKFCCCIKK